MMGLHPEEIADMRKRGLTHRPPEPCWACRLAWAAIIGSSLAFAGYLAWSLLQFTAEAATTQADACHPDCVALMEAGR